MTGWRICAVVLALGATAAAPGQAENFWSSLTKDVKEVTGAIKGGIQDLTEGKEEVEGLADDARQLQGEFTGSPGDEPRLDPTWVAELQQRLAAQGFDPGPIDGAFGSRTAGAIVAFQRQAGLNPDGQPRPSLMRALRARTQTVAIAPSAPQPGRGDQAFSPAAPTGWSGSTTDLGPQGSPMAPPPTQTPLGTPWPQAPLGTSWPDQTPGGVATGTGTASAAPWPAPGAPVAAGAEDALYARFLEAHLALHPELAGDDDFALAYLSYLPADQACPAELALLEGGEFDRQRFASQVWPAWKARFAKIVAEARPPGEEVFRVQLERTAGEYDFATQAFALTFAEPGAEVTIGRPQFAGSFGAGRRFCTRTAGRGRFPEGFDIDLANADAIDRLPLGVAEAEAFDRRNSARTLRFVVDFVLEDTAGQGPFVGGRGHGTGRIVAAAALDPVGGQILHSYDPALFAAAPVAVDPWDEVPEPSFDELLLALVGGSPELAQNPAYVERFVAEEACEALEQSHGNEIRRQQLIAEWRPRLVERAAAARDRAEPLVRVTLDQRLGTYDMTREAFALADTGSGLHDVGRLLIQGVYCPWASTAAPGAFTIVLEPPRTLFETGIPVAPEVARRILDQGQGGPARTVRLDLHLRLGTPGEVDGNPARVAGTIVDARVREHDGGAILHHYGTAFFGGQVASTDPYAAFEAASYERLVLAYLAGRPQLIEDRSFALRYAAATRCEALAARHGNEFARAELVGQVQQELHDALATASETELGLRVGFVVELGEYDFAGERFPIAVPAFDQRLYRDLLDEPMSALLVEPDDRKCREDRVASPAFPDGFLLTLAGAEALAAIGVPMAPATAKAFLERNLPRYQSPRAVEVDMIVETGAPRDPALLHPQKDEHVGIVPGRVVSARVLEPSSREVLHDYGTEPFRAAIAAATGSADAPPDAPEAAELAEPTAAPTGLPAVSTVEAAADPRAATEFEILDLTVGMTEAEALAAITTEFTPDQIALDPGNGVLSAHRGPCHGAPPGDPAIASEAGAFCLELRFADGAVSRVALRQVVPGDVSGRALAAFRERYGDPAFETQAEPGAAIRRSLLGWGQPLASRAGDPATPAPDAPTVLAGDVWQTHGVTVAVLRLERQRQPEGSESLGQEIKF